MSKSTTPSHPNTAQPLPDHIVDLLAGCHAVLAEASRLAIVASAVLDSPEAISDAVPVQVDTSKVVSLDAYRLSRAALSGGVR